MYSTLGTAGDTSASQTVFGKVAAIKAEADLIKGDTSGISGIGQDTTTIMNRIGNTSDTNANNTLFGRVYSAKGTIGQLTTGLHDGMWGNGGSMSGFIMDSGVSTYCVKAAASAGGIQW